MMLPALLLLALQAPAPQQPAMTTYQMVFFRKGPNAAAHPPDAQKIQEHLANLAELNRRRINLLYGPLLDGGDLEGIAVFAVSSADEARKLCASDPFVQSGGILIDVRPWLGPKDGFQEPVTRDVTEAGALEPFVLGFLVNGTNRSQDQATADELQKGHLAYMSALHDQGKLVVAGPFLDETASRGIVIYRVASIAEATALAAGDPDVKAGRLVIEAHPWMTLKGILK